MAQPDTRRRRLLIGLVPHRVLSSKAFGNEDPRAANLEIGFQHFEGISRSIGTPEDWTEVPKMFCFPGGEHHISFGNRQLRDDMLITLVARFPLTDPMMVMLAVDAIRRKLGPAAPVELVLPYFPYARQDRVMVPGEPLSCRVFCTFLNQLNLAAVHVLDPHSSAVELLLDRAVIYSNKAFAETAMASLLTATKSDVKNVVVVAADAGAAKKLGSWFSFAPTADSPQSPPARCVLPVVNCSKQRDLHSGRIINTEVHGDVRGKDVVIIDDVIDGGATFEQLGIALKTAGANAVHLIVTHGIFSNNLNPIPLAIDRVVTTDSHPGVDKIRQPLSKSMQVLPYGEFLRNPAHN